VGLQLIKKLKGLITFFGGGGGDVGPFKKVLTGLRKLIEDDFYKKNQINCII
jgi:hypothetical protein